MCPGDRLACEVPQFLAGGPQEPLSPPAVCCPQTGSVRVASRAAVAPPCPREDSAACGQGTFLHALDTRVKSESILANGVNVQKDHLQEERQRRTVSAREGLVRPQVVRQKRTRGGAGHGTKRGSGPSLPLLYPVEAAASLQPLASLHLHGCKSRVEGHTPTSPCWAVVVPGGDRRPVPLVHLRVCSTVAPTESPASGPWLLGSHGPPTLSVFWLPAPSSLSLHSTPQACPVFLPTLTLHGCLATGLGGGCREGQVGTGGKGLGSRSPPPTLGEMDGGAHWVGSAKICVLWVLQMEVNVEVVTCGPLADRSRYPT